MRRRSSTTIGSGAIGRIVRFLEGAEIDDFDIMEEGLNMAEPAEPQFNIWLIANC